MKYWRAVCPVKHFIPSAWEGWTEVSREVVPHTAGIRVRGGSKTDRQPSSGEGIEYVHLVKPRTGP